MKHFTLLVLILLTSFGLTHAVDLPLDFESGTYDITDFDGGVLTIIDNPQSGGINTSTKVGQMVKNEGETWGGSYITLDNPIDFSNGKTFKMKIYSPRVDVKVLLKVENLDDSGTAFEKEVSTTVANEWEELTFDYGFIDDTKSYQKVVLIFDNGTAGDGSANFTFLIDDIRLVDENSGLEDLRNSNNLGSVSASSSEDYLKRNEIAVAFKSSLSLVGNRSIGFDVSMSTRTVP